VAQKFVFYSERRLTQMRVQRLGRLAAAGLGVTLLTASCVHDNSYLRAGASPLPADALALMREVPLEQTALQPLSEAQAKAANDAIPVTGNADGSAAAIVFRAGTALDQYRSLNCLAQAVYYEARSESVDGQRAVAQVVLNRLSHPAYPATVCGVVYQGPMKRGGGCQFTFTCDGSMTNAPRGPGWEEARRIAADALSGQVFAPVGHATHYHTLSVFPTWAPSLIKSAIIGNHVFYRLPGVGGQATAFRQAYAGREPLPVPTRIFFGRGAPARIGRPSLQVQLASLALPARGALADPASFASAPADNLPRIALTDRSLPDSRIKEAYRNSGMIKTRAGAGTLAPDLGR
jgi:spore germination cell wall hydrolase CwlJ-like protein